MDRSIDQLDQLRQLIESKEMKVEGLQAQAGNLQAENDAMRAKIRALVSERRTMETRVSSV